MNKISGKVIHGDHYGKKLGFPTANLDRREYIRKKMKIRFGVWAGYVVVAAAIQLSRGYVGQAGRHHRWKAGIVIGPLDKHRLPKIEAHLINFKGNLYGKKITISLKKYLRPFKKFKNLTSLTLRIQKDLQKIKKLT